MAEKSIGLRRTAGDREELGVIGDGDSERAGAVQAARAVRDAHLERAAAVVVGDGVAATLPLSRKCVAPPGQRPPPGRHRGARERARRALRSRQASATARTRTACFMKTSVASPSAARPLGEVGAARYSLPRFWTCFRQRARLRQGAGDTNLRRDWQRSRRGRPARWLTHLQASYGRLRARGTTNGGLKR